MSKCYHSGTISYLIFYLIKELFTCNKYNFIVYNDVIQDCK